MCSGLVGPNPVIQNDSYCFKLLSILQRLRQQKAMITPRLAQRANRTKRGQGGCTGDEWDWAPQDGEGHGMVVETLGGGEGKSGGSKGWNRQVEGGWIAVAAP